MKKIQMILPLLLALLLLLPVVAAAENLQNEGDEPGWTDPGTTDPDPGTDPGTDPGYDPGGEDPTEPPAWEDPTEEPGWEDPTEEPTPWDEPTEEPTPWVDPDGNGGDTNGTSSAPPRVVNGSGGGIRQPNVSSGITSKVISGGGSRVGADNGSSIQEPRYITFARVTQKSNSMSRVLFYSGSACIGGGVLGLIVLAVFIARGRRSDREEIFNEIEQAAMRQPVRDRAQVPEQMAAYGVASRQLYDQMAEDGYDGYEEDDPYAEYDEDYDAGYDEEYGGYDGYDGYEPGYEARTPSLYSPDPEDLVVPMNGSLYTEEFEIPQVRQPMRPAAPQPPRQPPAQVSMYTEEFYLPDEMAQRPAPVRQPERPVQAVLPPRQQVQQVRQRPVQAVRPQIQQVQQPRPQAPAARTAPVQPAPRPSSQVPADQMNTVELLREILQDDSIK